VIDTGEVRRRKGPVKAGVRSKVGARSVLVLREHTAPVTVPDTSAAASVAAQEQNSRGGATG
jgi:hypothetical protein